MECVKVPGAFGSERWEKRRRPDSNWCTRLCRPLPNLSATAPRAPIVASGLVASFEAMQARTVHLVGCGWFWAWALVGCAVALAAISLGPILLLPTVAAAG